MTVHIPMWVFWTLGGVVGLVILGLAALAVYLIWMFRKVDFRLNW